MSENWTPQEEAEEEKLLATYIAEQVTGRASGRLEEECLFNLPHDRYFVGNLRSAAGENDENETRFSPDLRNKLAPVAFGAEFLARPQNGELNIEVSIQWACYYRVFPTYKQQREFQHITDVETTEQSTTKSVTAKVDNTGEEVEPEDDEERAARWALERERLQARDERKQQKLSQHTLCPLFRKISCQAIGHLLLRENADGELVIDKSSLENAVEEEVTRVQQVALENPERLRSNSTNLDSNVNVPDTALSSASAYNRFKEQLKNEIPLSWKWEIQVACDRSQSLSSADSPDSKLVSINFTNMSPMSDRSLNRENFFFDTSAKFRFTKGDVKPFILELAPRGFRYDRNLWGRGFNCAVEKITDTEYRTTHTPHHSQMRYLTGTEPQASI